MKKLTLFSFLLLSISTTFVLSSCVKKDTTFTITLADQNLTSDPFIFDGKDKNLVVKQINSDITNLIKKNGGDPTKIKSVKLKSLKLVMTSAGQNFDKITYMSSWLLNSPADTAGTKLAYKSPIVAGSTTIDFDNNYSELINYFKTDAFYLKLVGYHTADLPTMTYKASMSVDVIITP